MFKRGAFALCCFVLFFAGCVSDRTAGRNDKNANIPFPDAKPVKAVFTAGHGGAGTAASVWQDGSSVQVAPEDLHIWIQDASLDENKAPWYDIMNFKFGVITQELDLNVQYRLKLEWVNKSYKKHAVKLLFLDKSGRQNGELTLGEKAQTVRLGDENKFLPPEGKCDVSIPGLSWRKTTYMIAIPNPKLKDQKPGTLVPVNQFSDTVSPKKGEAGISMEQLQELAARQADGEAQTGAKETPMLKGNQVGLDIPGPVKFSVQQKDGTDVMICLGVDTKTLLDKYGKVDPGAGYKKAIDSFKTASDMMNKVPKGVGEGPAKEPKTSPVRVTHKLLGYITLTQNPTTKEMVVKEGKVVLGATGSFNTTRQFLVWVVPAYVSLSSSTGLEITFSTESASGVGNFFVPKSIEWPSSLGVEGGFGIPRVLSAGMSFTVKVNFSVEKSQEGAETAVSAEAAYTGEEDPGLRLKGKYDLDASVKATVFVFFNWTYKIWGHDGVFFDKSGFGEQVFTPENMEAEGSPAPGGDNQGFVINDASYQADKGASVFITDELPQAGVRNEQTVLKNVPFGTEPKIYQVGSEEVMIWVGEAPKNANRPKFNDFALQYATRKAGSNGPFQNKGLIHDIKIDGQYTNDGDFTAIEFKGYLYLAWVKQTKPVANGTKLEDTYKNTAIYTMWYSPAGRFSSGKWDGVEKVSTDVGYLQYMPKFYIKKMTIGIDFLHLVWIAKENNDYFGQIIKSADNVIYTTMRNRFSGKKWAEVTSATLRVENISMFAAAYDFNFLNALKDGNILLTIHNTPDKAKLIRFYVKNGKNYFFVSAHRSANASNVQMGMIDDQHTAFWYDNGEVKYCNIAEVIKTKKMDSVKTINGGTVSINENYELVRNANNNVVGLLWDNSSMEDGQKNISQGYALPYLEKEKTWGKAVPITYRSENSVVTGPNGFVRSNGEWVIAYRKLIQYDGAIMSPQNFFKTRVDAAVANMNPEPVLNTYVLFEADNQLQHVGKKMEFTALVNNYGLTPVDQVTVTLKTKDGKKLGDFTSKQKLLPGEMVYIGAQIDKLPGKDGVVPRTEIIASASYKGKTSEFAGNSVPYVIGVPNLLVHDIYIQMKNGKPVANMYLSSLNGVNVPAGNAELVISETEIKSLPNGKEVESAAVERVKPVPVRLSDVPQKFEEVCNLPNMGDYETVVTKRYSFTLRLKGEQAQEAGEDYAPSTASIVVASPYYSRPAVEVNVYQADYDVQTKRVTALVGVINNMPEKFSDTMCVDLLNGYTKEAVQSARFDVAIPANNTNRFYVEFEPLEGKTGANEYAVRAHGDGGKFFGSISQWQDFIKLASSTRPAGSPRAELTEELSSLLPASRPEDALLYKVVEEHYGIALRKETRDYLNEPGRTLQDLYEALLAEKAPQLGVMVK